MMCDVCFNTNAELAFITQEYPPKPVYRCKECQERINKLVKKLPIPAQP